MMTWSATTSTYPYLTDDRLRVLTPLISTMSFAQRTPKTRAASDIPDIRDPGDRLADILVRIIVIQTPSVWSIVPGPHPDSRWASMFPWASALYPEQDSLANFDFHVQGTSSYLGMPIFFEKCLNPRISRKERTELKTLDLLRVD